MVTTNPQELEFIARKTVIIVSIANIFISKKRVRIHSYFALISLIRKYHKLHLLPRILLFER